MEYEKTEKSILLHALAVALSTDYRFSDYKEQNNLDYELPDNSLYYSSMFNKLINDFGMSKVDIYNELKQLVYKGNKGNISLRDCEFIAEAVYTYAD